MKRLILLSIFPVLIGCIDEGKGKGHDNDLPSAAPVEAPDLAPTVVGVWEYFDTSRCSGSALFGDAPKGCIRFAELVTYSDGSAFYSIHASWIYGVNGYLPAGTTNFTREHGIEMSPLYFTYRISGDLSQSVPVLSIKFDSDSDFTDTSAINLTLAVPNE